MVSKSCSLWILVARTDLPFLRQTLPHLVRMSQFPFCEKVLAVDTAPLSGDKLLRPGIGTLEQLKECCNEFLEAGIIDRIVDINYSKSYQDQVYRKHFGCPIQPTHNYKGYPILGTIFHIEEAQGDYFLHYDSDMLLYQEPGYNWIEEGIKMMEENPEIVAIRPLTGPPKGDGEMYQQYPYQYNPKGFYTFKFFSSRVYLINKKRFDQLLPLPILWRSYKNTFLNSLPLVAKNWMNVTTQKGKLDSWEVMVSNQLERTEYIRAVLESPKAWTLHPKDRSPEFLQALPQIIQKIESGSYPPEQAGHYDLLLQYWL